jgi:ankyrin repeat protein
VEDAVVSGRAHGGHWHIVHYWVLENKGASVVAVKDNVGRMPCYLACEDGYLDIVHGWTPSHFACKHGCDDIVKYLAEQLDTAPIVDTWLEDEPLHLAWGTY